MIFAVEDRYVEAGSYGEAERVWRCHVAAEDCVAAREVGVPDSIKIVAVRDSLGLFQHSAIRASRFPLFRWLFGRGA